MNLVLSSTSDKKRLKNSKNQNSPEKHMYVAFGA